MALKLIDKDKEKRLIEKCKHDKEAFSELYSSYKPVILNFIKSRVLTKETAEDLTSTTFQKAFAGIESFKWQGIPFSAWLFRIARNQIIDHYRSSVKVSTFSIDSVDIQSKAPTPEESFLALEFEEKIRGILEKLPEKERNIVYMKFFEGYTNKTIARLTGLSETNVGTIVHRTLGKLRTML